VWLLQNFEDHGKLIMMKFGLIEWLFSASLALSEASLGLNSYRVDGIRLSRQPMLIPPPSNGLACLSRVS
jgi:hypothetical protein